MATPHVDVQDGIGLRACAVHHGHGDAALDRRAPAATSRKPTVVLGLATVTMMEHAAALIVDGELVVTFGERPVRYPFDELDRLALAYATTVHKSQGSEYPAVVVPVSTQHYPMLQRNLFYTAVTRGRRLVVLIGEARALAIAVRSTGHRRWSRLSDWLGSGSEAVGAPVDATVGGDERAE